MIEKNNQTEGIAASIPVEAKPIEGPNLAQEAKVIQETTVIEQTTLTKTISDPYPWRRYVSGGTDSSGYRIVYLIHKSDDFAIYLDEKTAVMDGTTEAEAKLSAIASEIATVKSHLPKDKGECDKINRQVAKAMWLGVIDKPEEGRTVMERVIDRFVADARLIYLVSVMGACASIWAAGALYFSILKPPYSQLLWFQAMALGSTGGVFSVMANQTRIPVDLNNSKMMHCTTGASRALVGLIAGAVCLLSIKGGIFLGLVERGASEMSELFFCFLSGFSETFIPNILRQHEADSEKRASFKKQRP
jgi:hypothetical protein